LTKFFALPGLRIGYLVAHPSVAQTLGRRLEPWSVNTLALAAAAESLKDSGYRKRTLELITSERKYLLAALEKLAWLEPFPSQTNFVARASQVTTDLWRHVAAKARKQAFTDTRFLWI
jgi:threonine-phosphate decarboxylase